MVRVALLCVLLSGCGFHCTGIEHELGASVTAQPDRCGEKRMNAQHEPATCPAHSGLETWVKIGMAGIASNILLLAINLILSFSVHTSLATLQATNDNMNRRIEQLEARVYKP